MFGCSGFPMFMPSNRKMSLKKNLQICLFLVVSAKSASCSKQWLILDECIWKHTKRIHKWGLSALHWMAVGSLGRACVLVIYCKLGIRNKPWLMILKLESLNTACCYDSLKDDFYLSEHFQTDPGSVTLPNSNQPNREALCGGKKPQNDAYYLLLSV